MYSLIHCYSSFQRLQFDVTSPNGVLLFREASKTITSFGEHILTLTDIPADKIYPLKYPLSTFRSALTMSPQKELIKQYTAEPSLGPRPIFL